jgi:hypothetical protein
LHDRLNCSKNIIFFLSSITKNSWALREEIDFGVNTNGLPIIVIYPEYCEKSDIINCSSETFKKQIKDLWDILPVFRNAMNEVPTLHIPFNKVLIKKALNDADFIVNTRCETSLYYYKC